MGHRWVLLHLGLTTSSSVVAVRTGLADPVASRPQVGTVIGHPPPAPVVKGHLMPLVSVLTPVHAPRADHLDETWASLAVQTLPDGWEFEWVVQEDGTDPELRQMLPDDDRVVYDAVGMQLGSATTRNLALARARGEIVQVLDGDDTLVPGALEVLCEALLDHPKATWAAGRATDLLPDRTRMHFPDLLEPGLVNPGEVVARWREGGGTFPFHPAGAMARTDVVRAIGGWAALPQSSDQLLFAAMSEMFHGVYVNQETLLFRKWHKQQSNHPQRAELRRLIRYVVRQRITALRALAADQEAELLLGLELPSAMVADGITAATFDSDTASGGSNQTAAVDGSSDEQLRPRGASN